MTVVVPEALAKKLFQPGSKNGRPASLPDQVDELIASQKLGWKRLEEGYRSLKAARTKVVHCDGFNVILQFNPQRIVSTGARTDDKSIRERKCFLCLENLPEEQQGILYQDAFVILCNPAPIFDKHLTVSHVHHRPQVIGEFVGTLLDLARDLSPAFTVFYNGPKSGASAPDHMHFQALPVNSLPVEVDGTNAERRELRMNKGAVSVWTLKNYGREVLLCASRNKPALEEVVRKLLNAMKTVFSTTEEPLINVLCSFDRDAWTVTVFPRTRHRPAEFFAEGPGRILISPAAVDIGGFVVTPVENDFERVNAEVILGIFRQVSPDPATTSRILDLFQQVE